MDYLALLTLASDGNASMIVRGGMSTATLEHAAKLQPGIQMVQLASVTCCNFTLSAYIGWGVNATKLVLVPQEPVPAAILQKLQPDAPPAASSSSGIDGSTIGIIVGCTVGGTVVLVTAAGAALVLWRRRGQSR